ncbi:putative phylloplanin [Helianthus anomalus]
MEAASLFLRGRGKVVYILPSSDPTFALLLVGFTKHDDDDATVALSCGGRVIATTMTNNMGMLNIRVMLNQLLPITLSNITSSCRLVVLTPLLTCNATLPSSGNLEARLRFVNSTVISTASGLINSLNFLAPNFILRVQA